MEKQINDDIIENLKDWRDTYEWFADYSGFKSHKEFVDYMYHNPDFRNKVSFHYSLLFRNYIPELEYYQKALPKYMQKIEERIGN